MNAPDHRHPIRTALFIERGVDPQRADTVASMLTQRDRWRDSRRVCLECAHLRSHIDADTEQTDWSCAGVPASTYAAAGCAVLLDTLQHCPRFEWWKPSAAT